MVIKVIVSDVGDVLARFSIENHFAGVARVFGVEPEEIRLAIDVPNQWNGFSEPLYVLFSLGRINKEKLYELLSDRFEMWPDRQEFERAWTSGYDGETEAHVIIDQVRRAHGLKLISCTNVDPLYADYGRFAGSAFGNYFDAQVQSWQVGARKPDSSMYHEALRLARLFGAAGSEECVFIDDRLENIEVARRLGFAAIHYLDGETDRFKRDLAEHGLIVLPPQ